MVTDENYICDVIRSTCIQHQASNLINDFHCSIDQINSVEKRFTLRFCNELPDYYDIRWDSSFQEEWAFHEWLTKRVRNYIWDAQATPFDAEDSIDAIQYAYTNNFIQNGRANGKTAAFKDSEKMARKLLANLSGLPENADIQKHAQAIIFGKLPIANDMNKKGKSTMAMETIVKIKTETERYMSESEARYDAELKNIENKLQQDISNAQFEAQKARCDLENWFRAERIKEQEAEKAQKRKAYYDGLIASGFTEDQALKILLEEL